MKRRSFISSSTSLAVGGFFTLPCLLLFIMYPVWPDMLQKPQPGKKIKGMKQTAQIVPNVTLIPQSQEPTSVNFYPKMENGHYNYEGMKKLGQRFAEVFLNPISDAK